MLLLERGRISIPELASICEVSPRTISRDLDAINQAGIPIVSYPGLHGGVGIMENYKLEKRLFSTADVTTLLMGLGCIRSSLSGQEVANALAKVKGFIPEEQRREIELKAGRLTIDLTPWVGSPQCFETMELIQQAMEGNRLLQFDYTDRNGTGTRRTVEPYRLLLKGLRWYLDGYCLEREDYRIFKLSRIGGLELWDKEFIPRDYHPSSIVKPDFQDKDIISATLNVRYSAAEQLEELFGTDIFEQKDGEWQTAHIPILNDERCYRFLLSLGTDCQLIAPIHLCDALCRYAKDIIEMYPTKPDDDER